MAYLLAEILICLLIAAAIGFIIGWLIRSALYTGRERALDEKWSARLSQIDLDRQVVSEKVRGVASRLERLEIQRANVTAVTDRDAPNPEAARPIEEVPGIGDRLGDQMRALGITTSSELLRHCSSASAVEALASAVELHPESLRASVRAADLLRITSLDPSEAELLEAAGVASVDVLAQQDASNLATRIKRLNAQTKPDSEAANADEDTLAQWIAEAGRLT